MDAKHTDKSTAVNKNFDVILPPEQDLRDQISRGENPYLAFIAEASERAKTLVRQDPTIYTEVHHIIPKHAGGSNEPDNLVRLTYNDHTIAHYMRWIIYGDDGDRIAYQVMTGLNSDFRRELGRLGGLAGGPKGGRIAQARHKERGVGFYNSEGQRLRAKKSVAVNREQGTGAFDPENIFKAREALAVARAEDPEKFANIEKANLQKAHKALAKLKAENPEEYVAHHQKRTAKGHQTQKEKGNNIYDPLSQRRKSLQYCGIVLNGVRYSCDTEQRTYISETAFEYYLQKTNKKS